MKRPLFRVILLLSFFSISSIVSGQNITLGLKGGIGFSDGDTYSDGKLYTSPWTDRMLMNFNGGIILNFKLKDRWYLHSEVLFEDKGTRHTVHSVTGDSLSLPMTELYRNHSFYLQFPQSIRFVIPLSHQENSSLYVEAGPYFACYLVSKDVAIISTPYSETRDVRIYDMLTGDFGDDYKRFDWGATAGFGFLQRLWKGQLDFNLKFDHMLSAYYTVTSPTGTEFKNYIFVVAITAGYSLPVMWKDYK